MFRNTKLSVSMLFVLVVVLAVASNVEAGRHSWRPAPRGGYYSHRVSTYHPCFVRPTVRYYRPAVRYYTPPVCVVRPEPVVVERVVVVSPPPPVVVSAPVPVPAPEPVVVAVAPPTLQIPEGFVETGREYHHHGRDRGLVKSLTGWLGGRLVEIQYNDDGTIKKIK